MTGAARHPAARPAGATPSRRRRVACALEESGETVAGVVALTALGAGAALGGDVAGATKAALKTLLALQALDECDDAPRVELGTAPPASRAESAWRKRRRKAPRLAPLPVPRLLEGGPVVDADVAAGVHVVSGGTGGLGVEWAGSSPPPPARPRRSSSRAPSPSSPQSSRLASDTGATVVVEQADVSLASGAEALLARGAALKPTPATKLRVWHLAGVVDDGAAPALTWDRFADVLKPKVDGSLHLHAASLKTPVDTFVLFSSIYGLLGSRELTHYGAANAFQDGLAAARARGGLPALAVSWGTWADAGMAHRFGSGFEAHIKSTGMRFVPLDGGFQALAALSQVAGRTRCHAAVLPADWAQYAKRRAAAGPHPLAGGLVPRARRRRGRRARRGPPRELAAAALADRAAMLASRVAAHVADMMGVDASSLDRDEPVTAIGLSSMHTVEMVNFLNEELDEDFSPTIVFEHQRLFLECAAEALEVGGRPCAPAPPGGSGADVGVFAAWETSDYAFLHQRAVDAAEASPDAYCGTGWHGCVGANRVSYLLDLRGPSLALNTACSSSLTCVAVARNSVERRECAAALVGGANLQLMPHWPRARAGAAAVAGVGVGQDGRSNGLTAPNPAAQGAVLARAYADAGGEAAKGDVAALEAHGTGTRLGDPIELGALGAAGLGGGAVLRCASIKASIGHLEGCSGLAGLVKSATALRERAAPRSLHFETPNAVVPWAKLRVAVLAEAEPLGRRNALGVSSFGFGGALGHVALAAVARPPPAAAAAPGGRRRALAAHSPASLRATCLRLAAFAERGGVGGGPSRPRARRAPPLAGPRPLSRRFSAPSSAAAAAAALRACAARIDDDAAPAPRGRPFLVFAFTGQGAAYAGMGRALRDGDATFRAAFDAAAGAVAAAGADRADLEAAALGPPPGGDDRRAAASAALGQPALFCVEYALARAMLAALGRTAPDAVLGHSLGRSRPSPSRAPGPAERRAARRRPRRGHGGAAGGRRGMAALRCDAADAAAALERLGADAGGVRLRGARGGRAPARGRAGPRRGRRGGLLDAHGAAVRARDLTPDYWWDQARSPVRFRPAVEAAAAAAGGAPPLFVEVGPAAHLAPHVAALGQRAPRSCRAARALVVVLDAAPATLRAAAARRRRGLLRSARREGELRGDAAALRVVAAPGGAAAAVAGELAPELAAEAADVVLGAGGAVFAPRLVAGPTPDAAGAGRLLRGARVLVTGGTGALGRARPPRCSRASTARARVAPPPALEVYFSSVTALLGNAGQTDYGAANGALDAVAARRSADVSRRGPALVSVQWGPVGGHGMAAVAKAGGAASERAPYAQMALDDAVACLDARAPSRPTTRRGPAAGRRRRRRLRPGPARARGGAVAGDGGPRRRARRRGGARRGGRAARRRRAARGRRGARPRRLRAALRRRDRRAAGDAHRRPGPGLARGHGRGPRLRGGDVRGSRPSTCSRRPPSATSRRSSPRPRRRRRRRRPPGRGAARGPAARAADAAAAPSDGGAAEPEEAALGERVAFTVECGALGALLALCCVAPSVALERSSAGDGAPGAWLGADAVVRCACAATGVVPGAAAWPKPRRRGGAAAGAGDHAAGARARAPPTTRRGAALPVAVLHGARRRFGDGRAPADAADGAPRRRPRRRRRRGPPLAPRRWRARGAVARGGRARALALAGASALLGAAALVALAWAVRRACFPRASAARAAATDPATGAETHRRPYSRGFWLRVAVVDAHLDAAASAWFALFMYSDAAAWFMAGPAGAAFARSAIPSPLALNWGLAEFLAVGDRAYLGASPGVAVATNDGGDVVFGAVTVGADAFVGPAATLLPGAHVRAGAAVGAHAVVGNAGVAPGRIAVGDGGDTLAWRPDRWDVAGDAVAVGHKRLYLGATAPGEASPLRGHRHVAWALTLKSGFANFAGLGACRFVYEAVAATLRAAGAAVGPGLRLLPDPIAVTASPEYDALAYGGDVHYSGIILPGTQVPPGTTLRPPGPNVVFEGLLDRPGTAWAGNIAAPCAPDAAPRRKASGDRDPDWGSRPSRGDTLE
ncbi:short-chain dehydrogenase reductase SDR [Aureococcus anophagefferens]|nr:short-chain dehydrogenase reductase SDR [Aureococcus anophagefferens]